MHAFARAARSGQDAHGKKWWALTRALARAPIGFRSDERNQSQLKERTEQIIKLPQAGATRTPHWRADHSSAFSFLMPRSVRSVHRRALKMSPPTLFRSTPPEVSRKSRRLSCQQRVRTTAFSQQDKIHSGRVKNADGVRVARCAYDEPECGCPGRSLRKNANFVLGVAYASCRRSRRQHVQPSVTASSVSRNKKTPARLRGFD